MRSVYFSWFITNPFLYAPVERRAEERTLQLKASCRRYGIGSSGCKTSSTVRLSPESSLG
jgi:hypothetical protein